jgi:hypothetical protein
VENLKMMSKLNTPANKSIWAVLVGAAVAVVQNLFPDLLTIDVWNTVSTALIAAAVYFIGNRS